MAWLRVLVLKSSPMEQLCCPSHHHLYWPKELVWILVGAELPLVLSSGELMADLRYERTAQPYWHMGPGPS